MKLEKNIKTRVIIIYNRYELLNDKDTYQIKSRYYQL